MSSSSPSLDTALAFAEWDFPVFSVWGISDGACLCPKGKDCTSPGKHPIPRDGLKAGSTNPDAITKMLSAAGSAGNYGIVPRERTLAIDCDGEGWQERLRELKLPKTLAIQTANGVHLWFYWPPEYGPQPTRLFGWVVRSTEHPGYVVGPGSTHQSGYVYRIAHQNGHDIHTMLARIATFPEELVSQTAITVTGPKQPESVGAGEGRHDYLRDTARYLHGRGLAGDALFEAVWQVNLRFPEPKTEAEVKRAIGEVSQFPVDEVPLTPEEAVAAAVNLIVAQSDYHAANSAAPEWVSPLAAYGMVALVSGPPKSGKSTFISGLLTAREHGAVYLWGDPVPTGPMLLVTEEGGYPVVRKTQGLPSLYILDRMAFVLGGLKSLNHLLAALSAWTGSQEGPALVVIDTLAVWGDIKDENDAVAATNAVVALRVWAQHTGSAVVLVHHTRKGGGEHGEAIRGSGGIFAAVDQSVELGFGLDPKADNRLLSVVGRLAFGENKRLAFERDTLAYSLDMAALPDELDLDQFPEDGSGTDGLTREEAEKLWGVGTARANVRLKELAAAGRLVSKAVKLPGERVTRKVYWRPRPLLDVRSTGERMADIFSGNDEHD